jgi:hypothetical protein
MEVQLLLRRSIIPAIPILPISPSSIPKPFWTKNARSRQNQAFPNRQHHRKLLFRQRHRFRTMLPHLLIVYREYFLRLVESHKLLLADSELLVELALPIHSLLLAAEL